MWTVLPVGVQPRAFIWSRKRGKYRPYQISGGSVKRFEYRVGSLSTRSTPACAVSPLMYGQPYAAVTFPVTSTTGANAHVIASTFCETSCWKPVCVLGASRTLIAAVVALSCLPLTPPEAL